MHLESPKVEVKQSQSEVFNFLEKVENFEKIMPDTIEKFETLEDNAFLFQLKGMPVIKLKLEEAKSPSQVILGATSDKLPFTLTGHIEAVSDTTSQVHLVFEGEFNSIMAMMIKSPIKKFISTLSEKISQL